jgi:hypothetical protein
MGMSRLKKNKTAQESRFHYWQGLCIFSLSQTPWAGVGHTGGPFPRKKSGLDYMTNKCKIHKGINRRGVRRSPALRMVKISREGPGDITNTIMWDRRQEHPGVYRARAVLVATTIVLRKWNVRLHIEVLAGVTNCGDVQVAACSILRATRLSLDDCIYKWNT